jgi:uncharacterized membrane protein
MTEKPSIMPPQEAVGLRAEKWISIVLRTGVSLSVVLILVGLTMSFMRHPDYVRSSTELARLVKPGAAFPRTLPEVAEGLSKGEGRAVTTTGLLVLILTPILRVAISIIAFIEQRDRRFALISTTVLLLLLASLLIGAIE